MCKHWELPYSEQPSLLAEQSSPV